MTDDVKAEIKKSIEVLCRLKDGLSSVIKGKEEFLDFLLTAFAASGHVLIEDLPGLGKTTAAKTMAALVGSEGADTTLFSRIQFTPDLLPYDITGVDVFDQKNGVFVFKKGPVFTHFLLADEINRATPKVQSALLEAMGETQVTIGINSYSLEEPFFVMATQNPLDMEGTYPLPMAQLDRFIMKLKIGYPSADVEKNIVLSDPALKILNTVKPVCDVSQVRQLRKNIDKIYCSEKLIEIAVDICGRTRSIPVVQYGVSTRGVQLLVRAAKAFAAVKGRDYVTEQDLVDLAVPVLSHRIKLRDMQISSDDLIREAAVAAVKDFK
jgi:MoxR-like ATPase